MTSLHRPESSFGRLIQKPEKDDLQELIYEEHATLQDQIENLRTKISLKERYNTVQDAELEDCRLGTTAVTANLWSETHKLRNKLIEALEAEKKAVHNALRSHRDFQLALTGKVPSFAVAWLEDKVFDMSKRLNRILDDLACKRMKLKDSEDIVEQLERSPRPGTSKWETETVERCRYLEYAIENMKVKRETANILHAKYHQIKYLLLDEKGHYAPTLSALSNQLKSQKRELQQLTKMLSEAVVFQNNAIRDLTLTEKEASENRRRRRRQMAKMKKAVQKVLEENMIAEIGKNSSSNHNRKSHSVTSGAEESFLNSAAALRAKKLEVEKYQDKARRLVDCMRVPDLTYIPGRLKAVYELTERLQQDKVRKEETRNFLICQRDQLLLIHNYLAYTRQKTEEDFTTAEESMEKATLEVEKDIKETMKNIQKYGEITVDVRLGLISILELLDEGLANKRRTLKPADTIQLLQLANSKVSKFVKQIEDLKKEVPVPLESEDRNTLKQFVRTTPVPPKLIRVGTPDKSGDESDDDEYDDLSVPTRADIKAKNEKLIAQVLLKRGSFDCVRD